MDFWSAGGVQIFRKTSFYYQYKNQLSKPTESNNIKGSVKSASTDQPLEIIDLDNAQEAQSSKTVKDCNEDQVVNLSRSFTASFIYYHIYQFYYLYDLNQFLFKKIKWRTFLYTKIESAKHQASIASGQKRTSGKG